MARIVESTPEMIASSQEFLDTPDLPPEVRTVALKYDMITLYRLKPTGQRVFIIDYAFNRKTKDVTLTVAITGDFNYVDINKKMLVKPYDLEECELPGPDEKLGTKFVTPEEISAHIKAERVRRGIVLPHSIH